MKKFLILLIPILLLAGLIAYRIHRKVTFKPSESIDKIQVRRGVPVRVARVSRQDVEETVSISGSIEALLEVVIAPIMGERIEEIHVTTGQKVIKGQRLVTLDAAKSKFALAGAKASLAEASERVNKLRSGSRPEEIKAAEARTETAKADYNMCRLEKQRQEQLYKEGATTEKLYQDAENRCNSSRANLAATEAEYELVKKGPRAEDIKIAEAQEELGRVAVQQGKKELDDHYLYAPCDGVVSKRLMEAGDIADKFEEIFRVVDLSKVYLVVDVSELYISRITEGMDVAVMIDALGEKVFAGQIAEINPIANPDDRSYLTKVLIDNSGGLLRPGMFGRAEIVTREIKQALVVPADAIKTQEQQNYMLAVDDKNVVYRVDVTVGGNFGDLREITSSIKEDTAVIVFGQDIVKVGSKVTVAK